MKGVVLKNTRKNDPWALRAVTEWITERNKCCSDKCPMDILHTEDAERLAKWLSLFTIELRKKDGSKYPPATTHLILCALQHVMRQTNRHLFDIFDKKDVCFRRSHGTMETTYQDLHKEGIGVEIKHASITSEEEEVILWEQQILGCHPPKALVMGVFFFLNGKTFWLRGGKENRELKLSQFQRENDHWKYTECESKNFRGGLADLRRENEVVRQFVPVLETIGM